MTKNNSLVRFRRTVKLLFPSTPKTPFWVPLHISSSRACPCSADSSRQVFPPGLCLVASCRVGLYSVDLYHVGLCSADSFVAGPYLAGLFPVCRHSADSCPDDLASWESRAFLADSGDTPADSSARMGDGCNPAVSRVSEAHNDWADSANFPRTPAGLPTQWVAGDTR